MLVTRIPMGQLQTRTITQDTTTPSTLPTSSNKKCILRVARTTSTSEKKAKKPLGMISGLQERDYKDLYTDKTNIKRYST